jgi:hypothetical protein
MTMPCELALAAAEADIKRRAGSVWAAMRRYQMAADSFRAAGQPPPPPPRELVGLVYVTPEGAVEPADPGLDITAPLEA